MPTSLRPSTRVKRFTLTPVERSWLQRRAMAAPRTDLSRTAAAVLRFDDGDSVDEIAEQLGERCTDVARRLKQYRLSRPASAAGPRTWIAISPAQRSWLEHAAQEGHEATRRRATAILAVANGTHPDSAAIDAGISSSTMRLWIRDYLDHGRLARNRPPLTPAQRAAIIETVRTERPPRPATRWSQPALARRHDVSLHHVRRLFAEEHLEAPTWPLVDANDICSLVADALDADATTVRTAYDRALETLAAQGVEITLAASFVTGNRADHPQVDQEHRARLAG